MGGGGGKVGASTSKGEARERKVRERKKKRASKVCKLH
jgi:hypothetical protein